MTVYYNEHDEFAAAWLRNLIAAGLIADGEVDTRSIVDVRPGDLRGYTQCHFFAGIGGWGLALRLAGWPDGRAVWTGSCPCQPFSAAGSRKGFDDSRHLWPSWFSLIGQCRPPVVFGEQVDRGGATWIDLALSNLETENYACGAAVLPACGVGAPHLRQRFFFVANASGVGRNDAPFIEGCTIGNPWTAGAGVSSVYGADHSIRRVKPGVPLLVDGFPASVVQRRAIGNSIVPQAAAEFIGATMRASHE